MSLDDFRSTAEVRPYEVQARHKAMMGSRLLKLRLTRLHYEHAPKQIKDQYLPVPTAPPAAKLQAPVDDALFQAAWDYLEPKPRAPDMLGIMQRVQLAVCRNYNVSRQDLLSARRNARVVEARQVAMYLIKEITLRSLPEIGRKFGGRDHTTVLYSVRKTQARVEADAAFAASIARIRAQFTAEESSACV